MLTGLGIHLLSDDLAKAHITEEYTSVFCLLTVPTLYLCPVTGYCLVYVNLLVIL